MPRSLPPRASLEWLKKTARQNLRALRQTRPEAKLAEAQRDLARDYGFASWRALRAALETPSLDEEAVAAFLRLIGEDKVTAVRVALSATPALVNAAGAHPFWGGRPQPLHVAIDVRSRVMFDLLLDAGADVNGSNEGYDLWSPLMLTFARDREDMRRTLIERGARIGLVEALLMKDDALVDRLLGDGLPTAIPNGGSILAFARTPLAIDRLLALGAPAEERDRWGTTPIQAMSRAGSDGSALVDHMIRRGVAAAPEDHARLGDRAKLEFLAEADPAAVTADAVLMAAVNFGHRDLARWLIGRGADPNARATALSRQTALHNAAWNGDLEMARILVGAGADPAARDEEHEATPLGWAETSIRISGKPGCPAVAAWLRSLEGGG
ncbi:MAG TPA: ankyrin repeat domain-containing protein [Allosphingosinicella sp.]